MVPEQSHLVKLTFALLCFSDDNKGHSSSPLMRSSVCIAAKQALNLLLSYIHPETDNKGAYRLVWCIRCISVYECVCSLVRD